MNAQNTSDMDQNPGCPGEGCEYTVPDEIYQHFDDEIARIWLCENETCRVREFVHGGETEGSGYEQIALMHCDECDERQHHIIGRDRFQCKWCGNTRYVEPGNERGDRQ